MRSPCELSKWDWGCSVLPLHAKRERVAQRVPDMKLPTIKASTLVIVDSRSQAAAILADRFRVLGATVHVVANATAAAMIVRNKKVNVVFIASDLSADPALLRTLELHGVPYITFATTPTAPSVPREHSLTQA